MLLLSLLLTPVLGILFISLIFKENTSNNFINSSIKNAKIIALFTSLLNLFISLVMFMLFDFSFHQFQFVQEPHTVNGYTFYLGLDGISIYFVLLTTIIVPIALLSN
jgi:NADH:ubiquinone oxidoreductase subunit 4 (subunit M)